MFRQFSLCFSVSSAIHSAIRYESPLTPANSKKTPNPPTRINLFPMRFLCLLYIDYISFTHKMGQQKIASVFWQILQLTTLLHGQPDMQWHTPRSCHWSSKGLLQAEQNTFLSRHQQSKAAVAAETSGLGQLLPAWNRISGDRNQNISRAKYFCG